MSRTPMGRISKRTRGGSIRAALAVLVAAAHLIAAGPAPQDRAKAGAADSVALPRHRPDDPWSAAGLVTPQAMKRVLDAKSKPAPLLIHVGFGVLYRGGHIPNSIFAGPGSKRDGVASLEQALKDVPKDRPVVLYCGCCPWGDCPNVRPAFRAAARMGFTNVRVLYLPRSLQQDWIDHGYGVERTEK